MDRVGIPTVTLAAHAALVVVCFVTAGCAGIASDSKATPPEEGGRVITEQPASEKPVSTSVATGGESAAGEDVAMPTAPWTLRYHDGSANGFHFWQDEGSDAVRFETSPMTPERSSSGTYSGGEPRAGTLTADQANALWQRVRALQVDTANHAASRMKRTGQFALETPAGRTLFIISPGEALTEFETFLAHVGVK